MGVSKLSQQRGTILDEIMAYHREQLPKIKREVPLADLRALATVAPPTVDFYEALRRPGISLIAECKKASPSKGLLVPDYDAVRLAEQYVRAGARAISVLTDGRHFQGSLADLRDVRERLNRPAALIKDKRDPRRQAGIPILRKDFIFDPYQLYESRVAGADAVLLIAAVLSERELGHLLALAHELGLQALVEVHTAEELEQVLPHGPRIIGVNNRDLQTFEVDFENTGRLRALIPQDVVMVGESGIKTAADVEQMRQIGVDAILVGESLVKSKNIGRKVRELLGA